MKISRSDFNFRAFGRSSTQRPTTYRTNPSDARLRSPDSFVRGTGSGGFSFLFGSSRCTDRLVRMTGAGEKRLGAEGAMRIRILYSVEVHRASGEYNSKETPFTSSDLSQGVQESEAFEVDVGLFPLDRARRKVRRGGSAHHESPQHTTFLHAHRYARAPISRTV